MTTTPCHLDDRFISETRGREAKKERLKARALCFTCPVFDECWEAYRGEPHNIVAGTTPNEPARKAARAGRTKDQCINGHELADYGVLLEDETAGDRKVWACRRCADLMAFIADPNRPAVMPETVVNKAVPIHHGTVGGWADHQARGEKPCHKCARAQRMVEAQREIAAMEATA